MIPISLCTLLKSSVESSNTILMSVSGKSDSTVHYLPFKIAFDGQTEVNSYFRVREDADGCGNTAYFRGRELKGQSLILNKDSDADNETKRVKGLIVVHDSNNPTRLEITSQFDCLHVWQHDRQPDLHEVGQYLDHLEVAQAIHET